MSLIPDKWFQKGQYLTNSRFFTCSHGGHVGVHNNREKFFWEFYSIIMQNLSDILPLFCTPTYPSYHLSLTYRYCRFVSPEKTASGSWVILLFQRYLELKRCLAMTIL